MKTPPESGRGGTHDWIGISDGGTTLGDQNTVQLARRRENVWRQTATMMTTRDTHLISTSFVAAAKFSPWSKRLWKTALGLSEFPPPLSPFRFNYYLSSYFVYSHVAVIHFVFFFFRRHGCRFISCPLSHFIPMCLLFCLLRLVGLPRGTNMYYLVLFFSHPSLLLAAGDLRLYDQLACCPWTCSLRAGLFHDRSDEALPWATRSGARSEMGLRWEVQALAVEAGTGAGRYGLWSSGYIQLEWEDDGMHLAKGVFVPGHIVGQELVGRTPDLPR
jgi:hypothetical protein